MYFFLFSFNVLLFLFSFNVFSNKTRTDGAQPAPAHPAAVEVVSGLVAQGVKIGAATEFEEKVCAPMCWMAKLI